jgi:hypothetical protein
MGWYIKHNKVFGKSEQTVDGGTDRFLQAISDRLSIGLF